MPGFWKQQFPKVLPALHKKISKFTDTHIYNISQSVSSIQRLTVNLVTVTCYRLWLGSKVDYKDPAPILLISFSNFVTASLILISVARLIFLFTLFNIGWEIWLRQTLKTNKMGASFSNMKSLQTALYFWLFMKVLARL